MSASLRAGVACTNITPPVGTDLCGYGNRLNPNLGIHDELSAEALVLDNGTTRLALVTSDLIGFDYDLVRRIRELAAPGAGVPPEHIMLNASHTHGGPATPILRGLGDPDPDYLSLLAKKVSAAIMEAASRLAPARFGWERAAVQIGMNRRRRQANGTTRLAPNPIGPVQPYTDVLRVESEAGHLVAVVFSHAAHPVVLGGDNLYVTADYVGSAKACVRRGLGAPGSAAANGPPVAMFAQGCGGNVNAACSAHSFAEAFRVGEAIGAAVVAAAVRARTTAQANLAACSSWIDLPLSNPPRVDEAQALAEAFREKLTQAQAEGWPAGRVKFQKGLVEWAEVVLDLARKQATGLTQPFELQAFRIGSAAVIGLPGEVFVEYAISMDAASVFSPTLVLGYTNGVIGYVPTEAAFAEGGYEVDDAIRYYGATMLTPACEGVILDAASAVLKALAAS